MQNICFTIFILLHLLQYKMPVPYLKDNQESLVMLCLEISKIIKSNPFKESLNSMGG